MPTFTDASLISAGAGALLWAMLATERSVRRRTVVGLLAFVSLEAAVVVRYTNVVLLAVAVLAALLVFRRVALPRRTIAVWVGSVVVLFAGILGFDYLAYGSALTTGYSTGEITFSLSSVVPNLQHLPAPLVKSMPMVVLALGALGWMAARGVVSLRRGSDGARRTTYRRDAVIGSFLALGWVGIWGLYSAYDWTARMAEGTFPWSSPGHPRLSSSRGAGRHTRGSSRRSAGRGRWPWRSGAQRVIRRILRPGAPQSDIPHRV